MAYFPNDELVDTHCHLNFEDFDSDRVDIIKLAHAQGITRIIVPGVDIDSSKKAIQCAAKSDGVFAAVGIHPNYGTTWSGSSISQLSALAAVAKVLAIGEIGLDYYRENTPPAVQKSMLTQQLDLAAEASLPVILHNRESSDDLFEILHEWTDSLKSRNPHLAENPGVMHAFSGGTALANEAVSMNFKLGIGGAITYKNSLDLQSVITTLPLKCFILETDSPYLAPQPLRGKRNTPANVRIVAEKIAELTGIPLDTVAKTSTAGAYQLFGWREKH